MGSWYKQQLNEWKATLDVKADTVFDIGGAQDPIKGMTKSWAVDNYRIVDLELPHVQKVKPDFTQDMNEEIYDKNYGIRNGSIPDDFMGNVDLIFMLGVMDYVINPNIAMENIATLLKDDGEAWIEWPFNYATHEPVDQEGCRYSEGCVLRLVDQAGLKVTEMIRKMERSGLLRQWYAAEGQRAAKSYPYHGVTGFITKVEHK